MKTVQDLGALHRAALARGAELDIGGVAFNSARAKVVTAPPKPNPSPAPEPSQAPAAPAPSITPAPPPQEVISLAEHHRILAQAEAKWRAQLEETTKVLNAAIEALGRPATPKEQPTKWVFEATYGRGGAIETITATPEI